MKILASTLKKNGAALLVFVSVSALNLAVFFLYGLNAEPFLYALILSFFLLCAWIAVDFIREKKRSAERARLCSVITDHPEEFPAADTAAEADYIGMIEKLCAEAQKIRSEYDEKTRDACDYYTSWVHQIKTPIAVMKLRLSDESEENEALRRELFRIEQYADMALQYVRLGSVTNDLVIREYELDGLIKEVVRRYAPQFIAKKIRLDFKESGLYVITDRKWFVCILEQLVSNAVKYTDSGSVSIGIDGTGLAVRDSGIGIAGEDLPRIFEKGYTGNNGRIGKKSSGIGLYLAKKAADLLSLPISAESRVGEGTAFRIELEGKIK